MIERLHEDFKALKAAREEDGFFRALPPDSQEQARRSFVRQSEIVAADFDGVASMLTRRPVALDSTVVFTPIRLKYPEDCPKEFGWLAELSMQDFLPTADFRQHRFVRRIRLFEPDKPFTDEDLVTPGSTSSLSLMFREVTSGDKPIILDSKNTDPIHSNKSRLEAFRGLLHDVQLFSGIYDKRP